MHRAIVIANPRSGAARAEKVLAWLKQHLHGRQPAEALYTEHAGHAREIAQGLPASCPMVVVVGGDGTVNEVVNGLMAGMGRRGPLPPVGIIPTGTANVLAQELGIPKGVAGALHLIVQGKLRRMDLGLARFQAPAPAARSAHLRPATRYFTCMAGAGFDAEVTRAYHAARGKKSYVHYYVVPILKTLKDFALPRIRAAVDGRCVTRSACSVIVGNAKTYGVLMEVAARARPDDGLLDACVFTAPTFRDFARTMLDVFVGRHIGRKHVLYRVGRHMTLESDDLVPVQVDGDFAGYLPMEIQVVPAAVGFFVP